MSVEIVQQTLTPTKDGTGVVSADPMEKGRYLLREYVSNRYRRELVLEPALTANDWLFPVATLDLSVPGPYGLRDLKLVIVGCWWSRWKTCWLIGESNVVVSGYLIHEISETQRTDLMAHAWHQVKWDFLESIIEGKLA